MEDGSRGTRRVSPRDPHRVKSDLEAVSRSIKKHGPRKKKPAPGATTLDAHLGSSPFSSVRSERETWQEARAKGYSVKFPRPDELFIDIDDEFGMEMFKRGLEVLRSFKLGAKIVRQMPSLSGKPGRYHIVVSILEDLEPLERLVYQAALGSDPKRELLGIQHFKNGEKRPTIFFEKKTGRKARRRMETMQKAMAVEMLGKEEGNGRGR